MSIADKMTTVAENVPKVFDAGKKAAYDEFWDSYQNNGTRKECRAMFSGYGWTKENLKPKYNMSPTDATNMFDFNRVVFDMRELGVDIVFSNCWGFTQTFNNSRVTYITAIDASKSDNYYYMFNNNQDLVTIELFKVNANATYNNTFYACYALKNITFAGTIGASLDMRYSPLSRESIESIIGCLSASATGKTLTLKKTATEAGFTEDDWAALAATKPNWTISLV